MLLLSRCAGSRCWVESCTVAAGWMASKKNTSGSSGSRACKNTLKILKVLRVLTRKETSFGGL